MQLLAIVHILVWTTVGQYQPVHDDESHADLVKLARAIESASRTGNWQFAKMRADDARFRARVLSDLTAPPELDRLLLLSEFLAATGEENHKQKHYYTFLRPVKRDGHTSLLFRFCDDEFTGRLNYAEFRVECGKDKRYRIVDMYPYVFGQWKSQFARRFLLSMIAGYNQSAKQKFSQAERDYLAHLDDAVSFLDASPRKTKSDAIRTLSLYESLPDSLKRAKAFMVERVRLSSACGNEQYAAAIADYRRLFPNDPETALFTHVYFDQTKQLDPSIDALEALDRVIGGDAAIDLYQGMLQSSNGDFAAARAEVASALRRDENFFPAYRLGLEVEIDANRFDVAVTWLEQIASRFDVHVDPRTLVAGDGFAAFRKSPDYLHWLRRYEDSP